MKLWLRLFYELISWRFRGRLNVTDVGRRNFRVWPTDLDIFAHMNNGIFLTLQDTARFDLMLRSGVWQLWKNLGWYPVVVAASITYRKSLTPWQSFAIETKLIGADDQAFYVDQRFVVGDEVYSRSIVRIRLLKRSRGIVTPAEALAQGDWPQALAELPAWVAEWAKSASLPKGKEPAVSDWPWPADL